MDIDFDKDTIQFDNLYVPISALLMFNNKENNCYLNILEHVKMEIITSTCIFQFYQNISVKPSLVTTNAYYYLINVFSLMTITCEVDMAVTEKDSFAVTIVSRLDLCRCTLETENIYLLGTATNCTSTPGLKFVYTYNFVTEWLKNKISIPFYQEGLHILRFPSSTLFPSIPYHSNSRSGVYRDKDVPSISLNKLDTLVRTIDTDKDIFLSLADKNRHDSQRLRNNSVDSDNDLLDIDSWFGPEIEYSMIFMFISSIISILGFIILMVLCYKNSKVQYAISYVLGTSTPVKGYDIDPFSCSYDFLYVHFMVAILFIAGLYAGIKLAKKLYRHLQVYKTILFFRRKHGLWPGRTLSLCLEFSTFTQGIVVHIATIKSPISLLSMDDSRPFPKFSLETNTALNTKLVLTRPISLNHVDCSDILQTSTKFKLGIYQAYKLRQIMKGDYLVRVISYQNNILFPFSKLHSSCKTDNIQDTPEIAPFLTPTPEQKSNRECHSPLKTFEISTTSGGFDDINAPITTSHELETIVVHADVHECHTEHVILQPLHAVASAQLIEESYVKSVDATPRRDPNRYPSIYPKLY